MFTKSGKKVRNLKHEVAEKIKKFRKARNMTQTELAKRLWVNKSIISSYENEQRLPSVEMLVKLSSEFNVSIDYLLGIDKNKTIDVSSLTDTQIEKISNLVTEFKNINDGK